MPESFLGKKATIVVSCRQDGSSQFTVAESLQTTVTPRAIFTTLPNSTIKVGEPLKIIVVQGINPQLVLDKGSVVHIEDDQGGKFFKDEIPVTGAEFRVPMTANAAVSAPTPVSVRIRSNNPDQLEDEAMVTIVPKASPSEVESSLAALETVSIRNPTFDKAVIGVLTREECDLLVTGQPTLIHTMRRSYATDARKKVGVESAFVEAIWKNGLMKIVRFHVQTYVEQEMQRTVLDRKTGETVPRPIASHIDVEDNDMHDETLPLILSGIVREGPLAGKTLEDELRSCASLK